MTDCFDFNSRVLGVTRASDPPPVVSEVQCFNLIRAFPDYKVRSHLFQFALMENVIPHHFNPLISRPNQFIISPGRSFIHEPNWNRGTFFTTVGLLKHWEISNDGSSTFWISPDVVTWARTLALFGAVLDSNVASFDTERGGLKFGKKNTGDEKVEHGVEEDGLEFSSVLNPHEHGTCIQTF